MFKRLSLVNGIPRMVFGTPNQAISIKDIVATEAGNYTTTNNDSYIFVNPVETLNSFTVTLPAIPNDGHEISISSNDKGVISMNIDLSAGQSIITEAEIIRLPANSYIKYKWIDSLDRWTLIDKSPFVTLITNGFQREIKVMSAGEIIEKKITLLRSPVKPDIVTVEFYGGTKQFYGIDFSVNGDVLQWNGLGLDGFIEENDIVEIKY